jgi:CHAT domain
LSACYTDAAASQDGISFAARLCQRGTAAVIATETSITATPAAIRAELDRSPAHVLHITGHGSPGTLALENDDGSARLVTADEFADLAVPPGQMPMLCCPAALRVTQM